MVSGGEWNVNAGYKPTHTWPAPTRRLLPSDPAALKVFGDARQSRRAAVGRLRQT